MAEANGQHTATLTVRKNRADEQNRVDYNWGNTSLAAVGVGRRSGIHYGELGDD